ncbi:flagellar protein FlaG [Bacillus sp. DJP31]|uniref:flagellar protein FlaG n=1 Tax=Bacillus sp. DJP31 TaxID=3409789 RepID=UPI003BB5E097
MSIERISSNTPTTFKTELKMDPAKMDSAIVLDSNLSKTADIELKVKEQEPSKEKLEKVIKGMNEFLPSNTSLKFEMHEELKEYYVKIVDSRTNEIVREIPSKKLLDMYAEMTKFVGLLVDKKI